MRRLAGKLLALFPFDPRSRRALDETLLDWAHEQSTAHSFSARVIVELRSMLSLARTLTFATAREVRGVPIGWFARRFCVALILPAVFFVALSGIFAILADYSRAAAFQTTLLFVPTMVMVLAPTCCFYLAIRTPRDRAVPTVGLVIAVVAVLSVLNGWVVPASNQKFRVVTCATLSGADCPHVRSDFGLPESSLFELIAKMPGDVGARWLLASKASVLVAAAASVLFGAAVNTMPRRRWILCCLMPLSFWLLIAAVEGFNWIGVRSQISPVLATLGFAGSALVASRWLSRAPAPAEVRV